MPRLHRGRLIAHHTLESWNSFKEIILPVIGEADIEANSGNLRHQTFSFAQVLQCLHPLLAAHVNHAEVRIGRADLRIRDNHLPKIAFSLVKPVLVERILTRLKNFRGIERRRG
jgi:hypothetical protein